MAISLSKTLSNGVVVGYHLVANVVLYPLTKTLDVTVESYVSAEVSGSEQNQIVPTSYSGIPYVSLGQSISDPKVSDIYSYLIALPEWQGATLVN